MSKLTAPVLTAALAASLTVVVWTLVFHQVGAEELGALRRENARLVLATGPGASDASVEAIAAEFAAQTAEQAAAVGRALDKKHRSASTTSTAAESLAPSRPATNRNGHRNCGRATPHDAYMSFAWASDAGEVGELAKLVWFEDDVREKARAVFASMPDSLREQYRTPEELFAFFFAADALVAPPPGADVIEGNMVADLSPGRVVVRRPGARPQMYDHQFQQTPDGWKYVVPEVAVDNMPKVLANETLAKLGTP